MVDIELTIRTVQGMYIYHKDHTAESTIFTPWSKSVTPLPSLRKKIKAFKEDCQGQTTLTWVPLVSTPTKPPRIPRKHTPGKVRTQWSNFNHHFNLVKTNQFNTLGTSPTDINKINVIRPISQRCVSTLEPHAHFVDSKFLILCQTSQTGQVRDWDGDKAKTREQILFVRFDTPKPKPDNPTLDLVDSLPFQGLTI